MLLSWIGLGWAYPPNPITRAFVTFVFFLTIPASFTEWRKNNDVFSSSQVWTFDVISYICCQHLSVAKRHIATIENNHVWSDGGGNVNPYIQFMYFGFSLLSSCHLEKRIRSFYAPGGTGFMSGITFGCLHQTRFVCICFLRKGGLVVPLAWYGRSCRSGQKHYVWCTTFTL